MNTIQFDIDTAKMIIDDMIFKANSIGAKNITILFSVKDGLAELSRKIDKGEKMDKIFMEKWDRLMGWVPRTFEGHFLVEILERIDQHLINSQV